jgi:hypothetical protein
MLVFVKRIPALLIPSLVFERFYCIMLNDLCRCWSKRGPGQTQSCGNMFERTQTKHR